MVIGQRISSIFFALLCAGSVSAQTLVIRAPVAGGGAGPQGPPTADTVTPDGVTPTSTTLAAAIDDGSAEGPPATLSVRNQTAGEIASVTVAWESPDGSDPSLDANAAFRIASQDCTAGPLAVDATCTIAVVRLGDGDAASASADLLVRFDGSLAVTATFTGAASGFGYRRFAPADAIVDGYLGQAVALSADGNTALVGDHAADGGVGAAWIFEREGESWVARGKLSPGDDAPGLHFPEERAVALSADGRVAVIGASAWPSTRGAVYVYERGAGWNDRTAETALLTTDDVAGDTSTVFGTAVDIADAGDLVLVGASRTNAIASEGGAAYLFTRDGASWINHTTDDGRLTDTRITGGDYFGMSVALSGDGSVALIGMHYDEQLASKNGAGFVFVEGAGWGDRTEAEGELDSAVAMADQFMGRSAALSFDGAVALLGAPALGDPGRAFLFDSGGSWTDMTPTAVLTRAGAPAGEDFGFGGVALSADGTLAAVGSPKTAAPGGASAGAVSFFEQPPGGWADMTETDLVLDPVAGSRTGADIALSADGNRFVAGSLRGRDGGSSVPGSFIVGTTP